MEKIGVQMFGLQKECGESVRDTLMKIKEMGYTSVEICVVFKDEIDEIRLGCEEFEKKYNIGLPKSVFTKKEAEEYISYAREIGLEVESCHLFGVDMAMGVIDKLADECITLSKNTGVNNFVVSYMVDEKEKCKPLIESTNYLVKKLSGNNITLCYHNHDMEFNNVGDDETVLDYLFNNCDERLKFQCDIGWVDRAGKNALEYMRKYKDKVITFHIKDFAKEKINDCPFTAVGTGVVPIKEVIENRNEFNLIENGIIIEQDASGGNLMEDIKLGLENVKSIL